MVDMENSEHRWKKAFLGPISPDFLRISTPRELQESNDREAALYYQHQQQHQQQHIAASQPYMTPNIIGRLAITVAQAKLAKNYGMTRMDPYVRLRIGHFVYETQTDPNGGKNPRWNRVINCQLPSGVNNLYVEIYDECSFTMDELIAWTEIKLPEAVLSGETHEDWYPLSGKQGDDLEGMIDLVLSFTNAPQQSYMYQTMPPMMMVPNIANRPMPVYITPQPQVPVITPAQIQLREDDLKQIQEMFPNIEVDVIKSVFEANRFNKEVTINCLIQINEQ